MLKPYGEAAPDAASVRADGGTVFLPENAPSISQGYNPQPSDSSERQNAPDHEGIDIFAQTGTPVIAPAPGIVTGSFYEPVYGNHVVLNHGKGPDGLLVSSQFFHLQERLVKKGDKVARGRQIGTLGSTGLLSAGFPHLHYEIRVSAGPGQSRSEPVNPHRFWADGAGIVTCFDVNRQWADMPFKTTYPVPCRGTDWK
ncbi:MAG: M23 family metallopeptidase [Desulfobacterales bacterium]|nr:M23 family metallopeptidase [Desulfobacterales bacterium]